MILYQQLPEIYLIWSISQWIWFFCCLGWFTLQKCHISTFWILELLEKGGLYGLLDTRPSSKLFRVEYNDNSVHPGPAQSKYLHIEPWSRTMDIRCPKLHQLWSTHHHSVEASQSKLELKLSTQSNNFTWWLIYHEKVSLNAPPNQSNTECPEREATKVLIDATTSCL